MEILLLFAVIIILLIFQSGQNSKYDKLDRKLSLLEELLKKRTFPPEKEAPLKPEVKTTVVPPVQQPVQEKPVVPEVKPEPEKEKEKGEVPVTFLNQAKDLHLKPQEEKKPGPQPKVETPKIPVTPGPQTQQRNNPTPRPIMPVEDDWYTRFRKNNPDLERFIGENILSKIAITVLVLGVSFFVKYAIDKDWINEAARVGIGILSGGIVLAFAHKLHKRFKAFSSVLVAGGIAIFYFTIGIGFHEYKLFNQPTAFGIMLVITAFSVFISIAYDRIELATLSLIGGFATPFMVSTGQGNYKVLFTYILILDAGMLVLAYLRHWNLIKILSYAFTYILFFGWLESKVISHANAPYSGALIFGTTFYLLFICMNVVNNLREKRPFEAIEISILLSNTFLFYSAGMQILYYYHLEWQGMFTLAMGLVNLVLAWLLHKQFKADRNLVYMMIGLTLTFITLTAPVQLHGHYITMFWALEASLLMWLAQKSNMAIYRFTSVLILFFMLFSLGMDWTQLYKLDYTVTHFLPVIINKAFITGAISLASLAGTIFLLKKEAEQPGATHTLPYLDISFNAGNYSVFLKVLLVLMAYFVGMLELNYQLKVHVEGHYTTALICFSYHLAFMAAMFVSLEKKAGDYLRSAITYLSLITILVYLAVFTLMPLNDFKENILKSNPSQLGFVFHLICFALFIFLGIKTFNSLVRENKISRSSPFIITAAFVLASAYVLSVELLLIIAKIRLQPVGNNPSLAMQFMYEFGELRRHVVKAGFPILWGGIAFTLLLIGMKKEIRHFRIAGLLLIGVTLVKLFTYDISNVSEAGKIIAFIILGIVLLIISFMYQKIKSLVVDKTDTTKNEN